jgi:DNA helicase-2/ATP-dependent DNA helicase PcrA
LGKTLWTDQAGGEKVVVRGAWDGPEEARIVADEIENLSKSGESLNSMAILVRAGFQTREFEDRLLTIGIPYKIVGGSRFYERLEIRDALAYLRIINQPDDGLAFERIINTPKRGIGPTTVQNLHDYARANGLSLAQGTYDLVHQIDSPLKGKTKATLKALLEDILRWRTLMMNMNHTELGELVLDESGYTAMWMNDKTPEAPGRLENLKELIKALSEFESLPAFLEHVTLVAENNNTVDGDHVTMMTLHSAKGLEFDSVFLGGWEEGLFPHPRALAETGAEGLEEERRLAYVGLTRARKRAYILFAANRRIHGSWQSSPPSRFLNELPRAHTIVVTTPNPYKQSNRFRDQDIDY